MRTVPTPLAVLIIFMAVAVAVLAGFWYLNRSPAPSKEGAPLSPMVPGGVQPQQGGQGEAARPVTPAY